MADLAVWRSAHDIADAERRHTGPALPGATDARAQRVLDQRVTAILGDPTTAAARWAQLVVGIDARITSDPFWPVLADRLPAIDRAGIDVTALAHAVGTEAPLPDEQPAAALWWRLIAHLPPPR